MTSLKTQWRRRAGATRHSMSIETDDLAGCTRPTILNKRLTQNKLNTCQIILCQPFRKTNGAQDSTSAPLILQIRDWRICRL